MRCQLVYFNGRGRAEVTRLVFAAAGKSSEYDDKRITSEDWKEEKKNAPQGTLPYVLIDGKTKVGQSIAIARYFAREFKLYGKSTLEGLFIDEMVDIAVELLDTGAEAMTQKDEAKKAEMMKTFEEETKPKLLKQLEEAITLRGKGGFAVGEALTLADLEIYAVFEVIGIADLSKYPKLAASKTKTLANAGVTKWLKDRPTTSF